MSAQIVGAQASAEETAANQRRAVELGQRGFISKQSIDQRRSAAIAARAQVATLSAQRDEATGAWRVEAAELGRVYGIGSSQGDSEPRLGTVPADVRLLLEVERMKTAGAHATGRVGQRKPRLERADAVLLAPR